MKIDKLSKDFEGQVNLGPNLDVHQMAQSIIQSLTIDFGTFPREVTFWLCFSLATLILCLAGIFINVICSFDKVKSQRLYALPVHVKSKYEKGRRLFGHQLSNNFYDEGSPDWSKLITWSCPLCENLIFALRQASLWKSFFSLDRSRRRLANC